MAKLLSLALTLCLALSAQSGPAPAAGGTKAAACGDFFFHDELQICGYPLAEN